MRNHCNRLDCLINNQKGICRALRETGEVKKCSFYKDRRKMSELEIAYYEGQEWKLAYDPTAKRGSIQWEEWTNECTKKGERILREWENSQKQEQA